MFPDLNSHVIKNLFFLWMIVLAMAPSPTHAGEVTVKVGVYDNAPIVFPDGTGGYSGLAVEMLQYIASKEGWKLEYVVGSLEECLERLERGDIDLQVYIAYSKERALKFDFTQESLLSNWGVIYTWPGSGIESILDLEGKRVAVMGKSIHPPAFMKMVDSFGIHVQIITRDDDLDGFKLVSGKKADAVVVNRIFGLANAKKFNLEETNIIFNPVEIRYAAPKGKNSDLLVAIDTHLKELKANKDSIFYQSYDKAFGLSTPLSSLSKWVYWGFFLSFVLISVLFFINTILNHRVRRKTGELRIEIDERKQAEKLLRESDAHLRTLINAIPDPVWLKDQQGIFLFCNSRFEDLYGAKEKDIIGKTDYDFVDKEVADFYRRHDQAAMAAGKPCVNEEELTFAVDGHREVMETIKIPLVVGEGQLVGVLGISRDITERKRSEEDRKKIEERLRQAQKMEAIGTLAGGIAHDFNNMLGIILGYTELAKDDAPPNSKIISDLEKVLEAGNRAKDLVKQILAFSRQEKVERFPLQVQSLVKEALKMLRASIPTTIEIQDDIDSRCGVVLADPTQIHQILMNLCTNANHAMEKSGGILKIGLKNVYINKGNQELALNLEPGEYVELIVSDTGWGMSPDLLDKIFDPYFTTKDAGKGTGMGLAIIHGIIAGYGGAITVESEFGKGSTFTVYFPVVEQQELALLKNTEEIPRGKGRILFIDDEELLAEMGKDMLERLGYSVTVRQSSLEALSTFQNCPQDFDVIITDQTMPGLTGSDIARRVLQIRPDIPIILCTGYSNRVDEGMAKAIGIKAFALKPLTKGTLAKLLHKVLETTAR